MDTLHQDADARRTPVGCPHKQGVHTNNLNSRLLTQCAEFVEVLKKGKMTLTYLCRSGVQGQLGLRLLMFAYESQFKTFRTEL